MEFPYKQSTFQSRMTICTNHKNLFHEGGVNVTTLGRVRGKNMILALCYNIYQLKNIQLNRGGA